MSSTTGPGPRRVDRLKQRSLEQEALVVQLAAGRRLEKSASRFENPELQQLPRVVPLVDGMRDVESLVALESKEVGVERRCGGRGQRRLPDACLPFEKQRLAQPEGKEKRHSEPTVGHVVLGRKSLLEFGNGGGRDRRVV